MLDNLTFKKSLGEIFQKVVSYTDPAEFNASIESEKGNKILLSCGKQFLLVKDKATSSDIRGIAIYCLNLDAYKHFAGLNKMIGIFNKESLLLEALDKFVIKDYPKMQQQEELDSAAGVSSFVPKGALKQVGEYVLTKMLVLRDYGKVYCCQNASGKQFIAKEFSVEALMRDTKKMEYYNVRGGFLLFKCVLEL